MSQTLIPIATSGRVVRQVTLTLTGSVLYPPGITTLAKVAGKVTAVARTPVVLLFSCTCMLQIIVPSGNLIYVPLALDPDSMVPPVGMPNVWATLATNPVWVSPLAKVIPDPLIRVVI